MGGKDFRIALFLCFSAFIFYLSWSTKQSRQVFFDNTKLIDAESIEGVVFLARGQEFELLPKYYAEFANCFHKANNKGTAFGGEVVEFYIYLKSEGIFYAQVGLVHNIESVKFGGLPMKLIWPEKNIDVGRGGFMGTSDCLYTYFKQGLDLLGKG
ncbi:hypothetical protein ACJJI3_11485 [Microbulbifer sp. ZKSA004]|uniref:hypothetical protein n=1 Tax=unclassified Microbulbifer TaxID=2619833 RepID=UPI0039B5F31E